MSILTKSNILDLIVKKELSFAPELDKYQLQRHSVDLRLGLTFMVPRLWDLVSEGRIVLNMDCFNQKKSSFETITLEEGQYFEILPGEYVLVSTLEKIKLPLFVMAVLYPRSSVNRRGLSLDLTGIVDAGYEGNLIVPVRNNTKAQVIRIYPGERFCQLVFYFLANGVEKRNSRYHDKDMTVGVLPERSKTEMDLLKKGKLRELKEKYVLVNKNKK
ncbi:dCTP deaminase [Patescibacteria group bacterium]|nr:dCTP deaminase [Patescibacteria group bacterium]